MFDLHWHKPRVIWDLSTHTRLQFTAAWGAASISEGLLQQPGEICWTGLQEAAGACTAACPV